MGASNVTDNFNGSHATAASDVTVCIAGNLFLQAYHLFSLVSLSTASTFFVGSIAACFAHVDQPCVLRHNVAVGKYLRGTLKRHCDMEHRESTSADMRTNHGPSSHVKTRTCIATVAISYCSHSRYLGPHIDTRGHFAVERRLVLAAARKA